MTRKMLTIAVALAGLLVGVGAQTPPTVKRTILNRGDLSIAGREAVQTIAELPAPRGSTGKHTHPGEEISYVLEGSLTLEVEGKPPVTLKAGDAVIIEAGKTHNATNASAGTTKVLATYIVEKGKPLATPVP